MALAARDGQGLLTREVEARGPDPRTLEKLKSE
jgi:hypothetical protein